jgi:hypothetical protein
MVRDLFQYMKPHSLYDCSLIAEKIFKEDSQPSSTGEIS